MKVLLTGGNGFLGRNVLIQLLHRGYMVHVIVRQKSSLQDTVLQPYRSSGQLSIFEGSILDPEQLSSAIQGCDAVIHVAGLTDMSLLLYRDYLVVNKYAVENILQLMEQHHIVTLVHVSTANTIGYGTAQQSANETSPMQSPFVESFYARSKAAGEQLVLRYAQQHPQDHIIIVNPGFMVGPLDYKPSSGQLLLAAYRKPVMFVTSGGKSFLSVADAAMAIVNAITMGHHGNRYLLTGHNLSLAEFYRRQATVCGYRQRLVILPKALVLLAGRVGDLLRLCHHPLMLSTRNVRQLLIREYYDHSKATHDLQLPSSPIEEAIRAFFDNYAQ